MKRIGPPLLPVILAFILLAALHIDFPALAQTKIIGKATPPEAESETDDADSGRMDKRPLPQMAPTGSLPAASGSDASLEVTAVIAAGSKEVIAVELDQAADAISHLLTLDSSRSYALALMKLSDGTRAFYPIHYDLDLLNQAEPGFLLIPGSIEIPDDILLPEDFDTEVLLPVFLYDPAAPCEIPAVSFTLSPDYILLREADTKEALLQSNLLNQAVWFYFEGGYSWGTQMNWDINGVLFGVPGNYTAYAVSPSEEGITLPAGFPDVSAAVIVQDSSKFELGPPEFRSAHMDVCWTKETPDLSLLRAYYAIGSGDWQEDSDGDLINLEQDYLYVYYFDVEYFDTPYYFKLAYDGEESNILKVYMSEDKMYYDFYDGDRDGGDREEQDMPPIGQPAPSDPSEDGGGAAEPETSAPDDSNLEASTPGGSKPGISKPETSKPGTSTPGTSKPGTSTPGTSRPGTSKPRIPIPGFSKPGTSLPEISTSDDFSPPETSPTAGHSGSLADAPVSSASETEAGSPVSEAAPVQTEAAPVSVPMEEETDDSVTLSGNRIKKYLKYNPGQPLIVTKHQMRLSIPTDTGLFTDMDGQSLFRAELLSLSEDTFSLELSMDGVPLKDVPLLTITIPREAEGEDLLFSLVGADGMVLDETREQDGFLTFTVAQTGTFTVEGRPRTAPPNAPCPPILRTAPALALLGLYYFLRRGKCRHKKGTKGDGTP